MKMRAQTESVGNPEQSLPKRCVYDTLFFFLLPFSNAILSLKLTIEYFYHRPSLTTNLPCIIRNTALSLELTYTERDPHSVHSLAMASTSNRAFGEVVEELEAVLELHADLQTAVAIHPLFEPEWFENKVRSKAHQLQLSTINGSELEGLRTPSRLAKLHPKLSGMGFGDFHEEIAMAVVRQKIFLSDGDVETVKVIRPIDPIKPLSNLVIAWTGGCRRGSTHWRTIQDAWRNATTPQSKHQRQSLPYPSHRIDDPQSRFFGHRSLPHLEQRS